jgi:DNA-binding GntR family transcriptional regulator
MVTSSRRPKALARAKRLLPVEHGNSSRVAFQQIRQMIVHGKLSPGTWIVESEIAKQLGMSRTPVRAAIHALQREGFIVEQKGAIKSRMEVAPMTSADAVELYSVIGRVEGLAGRQIAAFEKTDRLVLSSRLWAANDQLRVIKKAGSSRAGEIFDIDSGFHRMIIDAGAGPRVRSLHQAVEPQTERYWRLYSESILINLEFSIDEHDRIIKAVTDGDADGLERALWLNWMNGCARLGKLILQFGERGIS